MVGELFIPQFNLFIRSIRDHWVQNLSAQLHWNKYFISSSSEDTLRKVEFLYVPQSILGNLGSPLCDLLPSCSTKAKSIKVFHAQRGLLSLKHWQWKEEEGLCYDKVRPFGEEAPGLRMCAWTFSLQLNILAEFPAFFFAAFYSHHCTVWVECQDASGEA